MSKNLIRRRAPAARAPDACAVAAQACAPRAGRRRLLAGGLGLALGLHQTGAVAQAAAPLKIGFVYVTPIGQAGWTFQHEQARLDVQRRLAGRVATTVVEGVAEGADAERVMRDLVAQGHRLIFATSFGYLEPALRVAADHPEVKFEHAGGYRTAPNLGTYNARFYEGRWLAGWLAGRMSRSGVAGYVAGFPLPEVVQGINAFTLGLRAARPEGRVRVLWLNTWFDPQREREAALSLVNAGADMLTFHSASPAVPQAAQELAERGVRVLGYHSDMSRFAPDAQLAAVTADWRDYFTGVAQDVLDGRWQPRAVWGGMKEGMVRLEAVHASVPAPLRRELEQRSQALREGRWAPFEARPGAPLRDQSGRERLQRGRLDDAALAAMDWFVQGVVGTLPRR